MVNLFQHILKDKLKLLIHLIALRLKLLKHVFLLQPLIFSYIFFSKHQRSYIYDLTYLKFLPILFSFFAIPFQKTFWIQVPLFPTLRKVPILSIQTGV